MRTVGVDLAAEPAKTAVATVEWGDGSARVIDLRLGATDADIVEAAIRADRIGVDAPFGWPDAFVEFLAAHHRRSPVRDLGLDTRAGRLPLVRRRTDRMVHAATGIVPLSVSTDLIAHVALRCAGLLADLAVAGVDTGRVDGRVVEAYPAAALQRWGLPFRGYKGTVNATRLAALTGEIEVAAPGLELGGFRARCVTSDDAFDAVIAALIARAVALGRTALPDPGDRDVADREGWIHLPTSPLDTLFG
ncbi:DUF429 domain-containing protein [Rhodococcus sp. NPDC003318]|uniref:DUF429 domain-containing protein n=1 Tax=Rhodococcus sp. NPDC003318 TaxID=3364503 RepID=UPI0036B5C806